MESSFAHLEWTKEARPVVGSEDWKTENKAVNEQEKSKSVLDDVWDHFWGDGNATTSQISTTKPEQILRPRSAEPPVTTRLASPIVPTRVATPELPKHDPSIPKLPSVTPGKSVDIVLKADQGTGRMVRGVIRDVLTRGDHPWGIKVRLVDGRVGRVQRVYEQPSYDMSSHV